MGVDLIAKNVPGSWNTEIQPSVTRGLELWVETNTDADHCRFNRAPGKPGLVVIGAPVYSAQSTRFKALSNFLQSRVSETPEQTLFVLGKAANPIPAGSSSSGDVGTVVYISNNRGVNITPGTTGLGFGTSLYHVAPTTLTGTGSRATAGASSTGQITLTGETPTNWAVRAVRVIPGGSTGVKNLTRAASNESGLTTPRVLSDSRFRIGSTTGEHQGEVDIALAIIYSVALTDDEINLVYEDMRAFAGRLGIIA